MNILQNKVIAEFGTRKAAEKFQTRVTNKTRIEKAEFSLYGFQWKNIYQLICEE